MQRSRNISNNKGDVTLLMMLISLLVLSWAVAPHHLAIRVTASKGSSSTIGAASCTKSNSAMWEKKREQREGKLSPRCRLS